MSKDTDLTNKPHFNLGRKHFNRKQYTKGITKLDKVCVTCNQSFQTDCFMPKKVYCSQVCYHKNSSHITTLGKKGSELQKQGMRDRKGEKHPRWVLDRNKVKRRFKESLSTVQYQAWRTSVFTRDNYKCKMINSDCSGKYLEAHHILRLKDYPELSYEINNGITLCKFHHPLGKEKETKLISTFRRLLTPL